MTGVQDAARLRRRPVQQRSKRTVERICTAASEILAQEGLEALTTNAVAARAGVSINAVYSYFPDKYAIMLELFRLSEARRSEALAPYVLEAAHTDDWRGLVRRTTLAAARLRVQDSDYLALRPVINAVSELRAAQREVDDSTVQRVAATLRKRQPGLTKKQAQRVAIVVSITLTAALDEATRDGKVHRALLDEAIRMVELYLRDLLHPDA